jgi:hypothetical protein
MYVMCTCEECQAAVKTSGKSKSSSIALPCYLEHKTLAPGGASFRCATVAELFAKPENY